MDKKDICILLGAGALITGVYGTYKQYKQEKRLCKLNKKLARLGTCHNNFVEVQKTINDLSTENMTDMCDRVDCLEDTSIANYNQILELKEQANKGDTCKCMNDSSAEKYIKDYYDDLEGQED